MKFNEEKLDKNTKHTGVHFYLRNGEELKTATKLDVQSVSTLITGTSRDERFIRITNPFGDVEIINLDLVKNVFIGEFVPGEDDEDYDD